MDINTYGTRINKKEIEPLRLNKEEIRDVTMNMTLSEIRERDIDNLKLVVQSAKKYVFESVPHAKAFIHKALATALMKFGIDVRQVKALNPNSYNEEIQRLCDAKQVTLERMPRIRRGEHAWRSGIYIYYRNEIAFFISLPQKIEWNGSKNPHIIIPGKPTEHRYLIVTNVN